MSSVSLDRDLPIPLYYQLACALREAIESGRWKSGEQLPSESQLAQDFGISKITVRQALQGLAELGYVRREHGRGTFVCRPKIGEGPRELNSFTEEIRRRGLKPSSRILERSVRQAEGRVAEALRIEPGQPVFVLQRLRMADGEPMAVQTAHIPIDLVPGLVDTMPENVSLYDVLQNRFGLQPARARETYFVLPAEPVAAELLGIPVASPVFSVERVTFLSTGKPFELVKCTLRGDRYSIILELAADRSPQATRDDNGH